MFRAVSGGKNRCGYVFRTDEKQVRAFDGTSGLAVRVCGREARGTGRGFGSLGQATLRAIGGRVGAFRKGPGAVGGNSMNIVLSHAQNVPGRRSTLRSSRLGICFRRRLLFFGVYRWERSAGSGKEPADRRASGCDLPLKAPGRFDEPDEFAAVALRIVAETEAGRGDHVVVGGCAFEVGVAQQLAE